MINCGNLDIGLIFYLFCSLKTDLHKMGRESEVLFLRNQFSNAIRKCFEISDNKNYY